MKFFFAFLFVYSVTFAIAQDRVKCNAKTKKGENCMNYAMKGIKTCYVHGDHKDAKRCEGITKKGEQCKRIIKKDQHFCFQHKKD